MCYVGNAVIAGLIPICVDLYYVPLPQPLSSLSCFSPKNSQTISLKINRKHEIWNEMKQENMTLKLFCLWQKTFSLLQLSLKQRSGNVCLQMWRCWHCKWRWLRLGVKPFPRHVGRRECNLFGTTHFLVENWLFIRLLGQRASTCFVLLFLLGGAVLHTCEAETKPDVTTYVTTHHSVVSLIWAVCFFYSSFICSLLFVIRELLMHQEPLQLLLTCHHMQFQVCLKRPCGVWTSLPHLLVISSVKMLPHKTTIQEECNASLVLVCDV